jgi:O-acetylserine/cysteine efflux transporter
MKMTHLFLVLLVILIWGINFVFVKLGIQEIPPLLLCAVRFFLASIPAIFFIKRPAVPFRLVAAYGLVMFALQFTCVFTGIHAGMSPGMASVIMQVQVFFSILFGMFIFGERPSLWQMVGALISFFGIALIGFHIDAHMPLLGFLLILGAAASWGVGNLIVKKSTRINMMALVVWGSFVASFPLLLLSLIFEGPAKIIFTYHHVSWVGITALLYIVYLSTWVGYGLWNWLLSRYPISTVVPFTLLIPIVGMGGSALVLGESLDAWKLEAGLLVIGGLCINLLGARLFMTKQKEVMTET